MKFIIYTPLYNGDVGGVIVLHKLCFMLNKLGVDAYIWHNNNPVEISSFKSLRRKLRYLVKSSLHKDDYASPYKLKIASPKDIADSIVVYPEVVAGNPLNARKVVRWLLYTPGKHTGVVDFNVNDLFFYYLKEYDYPEMNKSPDNQLYLVDYKNRVYFQNNFEKRSGTCYLVRKGKDRVLNYHSPEAIKIDGLSHQDIAAVFNKCEFFISYDLYTMYSVYAAICGCKSIVVPMDGTTEEQWLYDEESRYGVAYGYENLTWAERTRSELLAKIEQVEERGYNSVQKFIKKCGEHFYEFKR